MECTPRPLALHLATHSACPSSRWLDELAPTLFADAGRPLRFFNVGANKGFGLHAMLARFSMVSPFGNATTWHRAFEAYANKQTRADVAIGRRTCNATSRCPKSCGVCNACMEPPPPRLHLRGSIDIHAFEMLPSSTRWLQAAVSRLDHRQNVHIIKAVVSDRDGEACSPTDLTAGVEQAIPILSARHGLAAPALSTRTGLHPRTRP